LVNDKANKFLNIFGAGRSEVSINGMPSLDYWISKGNTDINKQ
jgi:hypothetical protein